ncbi:MAG: hypothetical protein L6R37_008388, partial [Teloschistes peruensis]
CSLVHLLGLGHLPLIGVEVAYGTAEMAKYDLKCQFRLEDVRDNHADCKNDAENDENEHRNGNKHESRDEE